MKIEKVSSLVPFEHQDLCYRFIEAIAKEYGGKITLAQIKELRAIVRKNFVDAGELEPRSLDVRPED